MTAFHYAVPASCLAMLLSTTGAFAQVTAQQVWDDWKSNMGMYGENGVTIGSEGYANGVLTVTDLGFSMTDNGATASGNLAQLVLTEQADGTVAVTMSDTYPLHIEGTDEEGQPFAVDLMMTQAGMTMNVSGAPGNLTYQMAAPRITVELDQMTEAGTPVPAEIVIGMNNVAGGYTSTGTDLKTLDYDMTVESVDVKATGAEDGASFTLNGALAAMAVQMMMTVPTTGMDGEGANPFAAGLDVDGTYTFGAGNFTFNATEDGAATDGTMTMTGGNVAFAIDHAALDYSFDLQGLASSVTSAELPFPVTFGINDLGFRLAMPMSPTDAPADFAGRLSLAGLTVNEEIWAMIDPGAVIPRDPATVTVDVTGTATMLVDLTDPAISEGGMAETQAPGELNSLNINDVTLAIGGADAHATGALTFDNTDLATYGGMPKPVGSVDIALNGVNGLIDKLVQIGIVPEEQVMGVRMMMGMFSVPVGDDQLTSKIEFTADGHLMANGQMLQ